MLSLSVMEVISIVPHIAKRKLIEILQISDSDGETMIFLLENKKTLSTALRAVGFRSTNEISRETWASLRTWRDVADNLKYFKLVGRNESR